MVPGQPRGGVSHPSRCPTIEAWHRVREGLERGRGGWVPEVHSQDVIEGVGLEESFPSPTEHVEDAVATGCRSRKRAATGHRGELGILVDGGDEDPRIQTSLGQGDRSGFPVVDERVGRVSS